MVLCLGFPTPPIQRNTTLKPSHIFHSKFISSLIRFQLNQSYTWKHIHPLNASLSKSGNYCKVTPSNSDGGAVITLINDKEEDNEQLAAGLRGDLMPKHIALIMDGNRRWAKDRGLPTMQGHTAGRKALKELVCLCCKWKIHVLSAYAFSTENWKRSNEEVDALMKIIEGLIGEDLMELKLKGYEFRLTVIGDKSKLPKSLQDTIMHMEEITATNSGTHINLAINYSGKYDIIQACQIVADKVKVGSLDLEDITENVIEQELESKYSRFPCPDLLIRTSGECRLSNFMLWQLAFTELVFTQQSFPDFGEVEFIQTLKVFQDRKLNMLSC